MAELKNSYLIIIIYKPKRFRFLAFLIIAHVDILIIIG